MYLLRILIVRVDGELVRYCLFVQLVHCICTWLIFVFIGFFFVNTFFLLSFLCVCAVSSKKKLYPILKNNSCIVAIVGVFIYIENSHIHKQSDQLPVGHTNICICSVWGLNPRQAAQQSVAQPMHQPYHVSCLTVNLLWRPENGG